LGQYDESLTGPEDIDLSVRASEVTSLPRANARINHDEGHTTLRQSMSKKRYYAQTAHRFLIKFPKRAVKQGNMLFRQAYFKNWKKFINDPIHSVGFVVLRICEMAASLVGIAEGIVKDLRTGSVHSRQNPPTGS
jgi:hypothetical protein